MVLLHSEVHCKNGQKGIYSLAVIIVYTSVTLFISSIYNYNINITLEKKTKISRFQFKKLSFLFVRRFRIRDISVQEVTYTSKIFSPQIY